jgi:hypothetical protein
MKEINVGNARISLIEDNIVLFEADPNIVIDKKTAQTFYQEIEKHVSNNYNIIIHRKHKYQLLRMEVFDVINNQERLLAMAIVAPREVAKKMADMEAPLCEKPFATFTSIEDAVAWIKNQSEN